MCTNSSHESPERLKPIFHWKLGSRWLPNANEINTKNMKCTWPTPEFCIGTQRNLYSTGLRLGFASGKTQILGFALAPRYQHVCIPNAKFWRRGYCPTPTPNARYFASQWNIGFRLFNFLLQMYGVGSPPQHRPVFTPHVFVPANQCHSLNEITSSVGIIPNINCITLFPIMLLRTFLCIASNVSLSLTCIPLYLEITVPFHDR